MKRYHCDRCKRVFDTPSDLKELAFVDLEDARSVSLCELCKRCQRLILNYLELKVG